MEILKISPVDTSNHILVRSKVLGNHVYDTLEHFLSNEEIS